MTSPNPATKALEAHKRLEQVFGRHSHRSRRDPIATLVSTILSQNTNDALRDKAFDALQQRFPTWEQVRDAPQQDIEHAIQIAGLSQQKAPTIQRALRRIHEQQGEFELDFLREMGVDEAKAWLTSIKGVGPKTAAIVLLFALDMPAFPVDTHIHRLAKRLGLIQMSTSREKAHELLEAMLPLQAYYAGHLNLVRHGREICQARRPRCEVCILRDLCNHYNEVVHPSSCAPGQPMDRTRG